VVLWLQPQHHTPMYFNWLILTTVALATTSNALPDDGVTAPKHVGSCFNISFNVSFKFDFKTIHLYISWLTFKNRASYI